MFDVAMGSYDGAEVCELVGLYILGDVSSICWCSLRIVYRFGSAGLVTTSGLNHLLIT